MRTRRFLRGDIERRSLQINKEFLEELTAVKDAVEDVHEVVREMNDNCAQMKKQLEETKAKILAAAPNAKVRILTQDLSQPDKEAFERFVATALEEDTEIFDEALFVHNAGSLGNHGKNFDQVKNYELRILKSSSQ